MKNDLKFKQRQLNDAESTAASLQVEVEARQQDLEKIKNLEGRIDKEMEQYSEQIDKMEDEMANKFTKTETLQIQFSAEKDRLLLIKRLVSKYRNGLMKQSTYHAMSHDTKKNLILQNDVYNKLNDIEKKLIVNESQIYAIQQYIEAKGAESNYQAQFQECMALSNEINAEVIKKSFAISP